MENHKIAKLGTIAVSSYLSKIFYKCMREEYERFLKINLEIFENLKEWERKMCASRNKSEN